MPLQNHVVSLELAQKMKELGFPQDTSFYWFQDIGEARLISKELLPQMYPSMGGEDWAAPLASELGEWLPQNMDIWGNSKRFLIGTSELVETEGITEADRRANLLIHLAEEGRTNPKSLT